MNIYNIPCICLSFFLSPYLSTLIEPNLTWSNPRTCLSVCLSASRFTHLQIYRPICLAIYLSICLSILPSICLSTFLSICRSVYLSTYRSIWSLYLSIYLSSDLYLSVCLLARLAVCPCTFISTCLPGYIAHSLNAHYLHMHYASDYL